MKMKKRVLCVYDGQRRLLKDDMMLDSEFEVRLRLPDGPDGSKSGYITDLDMTSMARSEAIHTATAEERGPWIPDNISGADAQGTPATSMAMSAQEIQEFVL